MKYLRLLFLSVILFSLVGAKNTLDTNVSIQAKEDRIMVAVVDTGIDPIPQLRPYLCKSGHEDFTGTGHADTIGHGTDVAYLISKNINPKTHCIVSFKWGDKEYISDESFHRAIVKVSHSKAMYINISAGGRVPSVLEKAAIEFALARGAKVIVSAGNDGMDMSIACVQFPACYQYSIPGFHVVGSLTSSNERAFWSNYGPQVTDWVLGYFADHTGEYMIAGTSFSTAWVTGMLVKHDSKP